MTNQQSKALNSLAFLLYRFIGWASRVEKRLDVYRDYLLTSYEMADPTKLHPKQLELLQNDPHFQDGKYYITTAFQLSKDKKWVKQREFFFSEKEVEKLGLDRLAKGESKEIGKANRLLVSVETVGQYLGKTAAIRPRAQSVERSTERPENIDRTIEEIGSLRKIGKIKSGMNPYFQSPPPSPK